MINQKYLIESKHNDTWIVNNTPIDHAFRSKYDRDSIKMDSTTDVTEKSSLKLRYYTLLLSLTYRAALHKTDRFLGHRSVRLRLVLDHAISLADSFEFTIYHCVRLKEFRHK